LGKRKPKKVVKNSLPSRDEIREIGSVIEWPSFGWKQLLFALLPVVVAWSAYQNALDNGITNWDDEKYLVKNELIRNYSQERMAYWFDHFYFGNYHPLTMISYMWEYKNHGEKWETYHLHNVLLHLGNTFLVFLLMWLITGRQWVSLVVSLLHGIHPMHVESVAWLAERKDVLFAFFYLASLCFYMMMIRRNKGKAIWYSLAIIMFLASLFSKAAAVPLSLSLFLIDYISGRKFNTKLIMEKIPFLLLSFLFGYIAIKAQQSTESIASFETFTLFQRFMFASYGFIMYVRMLFIPTALSCFHPYPFLLADGSLPLIYYLSPFVALSFFVATWFSRKKTRILVFGILFYLVNVMLVLQFLSVGNAVMSERYTYIPYLGLFFIIGMGIDYLICRSKQARMIAIVLVLIVSGLFAYATSERCKVWKNSEALWTDFINKYPTHEKGYTSRANYYAQNEKYDLAFDDFSMAIKLKPDQARPYAMRGNIFSMRGQLDKAMEDYNTAIRLDPDYPDVYFNRAVTYSINKDYVNAFADYSKAIELDPGNMQAYLNRAYSYIETSNNEKAIKDCKAVLAVNPNNKEAHMYSGLAYFNLKRYDQAIEQFNMVLRLDPNNANAWYNLAVCAERKGLNKEALKDAKQAAKLGYNVPAFYIENLKAKFASSNQ